MSDSDVLTPGPRDFLDGDRRALRALDRFRLRRVESADDPDFARGYRLLADEFGERGEVEPRAVLAAAVTRGAQPRPHPVTGPNGADYRLRYHFVVAFDERGALAGVRDFTAVWRPDGRVCVVHLSHVLVLPEWRRTGLGGLLRAVPSTLARRDLAAAGLEPDRTDLLLAAEMDPVDPADPATVGRLIAYGRAGFRAIPPRVLPYCQPDFRRLHEPGLQEVRPLPMLAVVASPTLDLSTGLDASLCEAFTTHLYAVFSTYCRREDLEGPLHHALAALQRRAPTGEVALLPLPRDDRDRRALAPLSREEVLSRHPAAP